MSRTCVTCTRTTNPVRTEFRYQSSDILGHVPRTDVTCAPSIPTHCIDSVSQTNSNDTCDLYYALRRTSVQMSASRCLACLQNRLCSPNPSVYRRIRIDIDICPSAGPFASCRALSVSHRYCTVRRPSASQKLCAPSPSLDRTFQNAFACHSRCPSGQHLAARTPRT